MFGAEAIQGKGGERAHDKNVYSGFISDDNLFRKTGDSGWGGWERLRGALKVLFCCEMSSYNDSLCISDDVGILLSHLGPKIKMCFWRQTDSRSWNEWEALEQSHVLCLEWIPGDLWSSHLGCRWWSGIRSGRRKRPKRESKILGLVGALAGLTRRQQSWQSREIFNSQGQHAWVQYWGKMVRCKQ